MIDMLHREARENDVIILHACAHNPTGIDPTQKQWKQISQVCKEKRMFPVFDVAYQGFVSGDPNADAWSVRHFLAEGFEMCAAQAFSKNFGLYSERVGCLHVVQASPEHSGKVLSQLCHYQRGQISTPPSHGARIVSKILHSEDLYELWLRSLQTMTGRIAQVRRRLYDELIRRGAPTEWCHILDQVITFTLTSKKCSLTLRRKECSRTRDYLKGMSIS